MSNEKSYFWDFLQENDDSRYIDYLKYYLDQKVYHYGQQFLGNLEASPVIDLSFPKSLVSFIRHRIKTGKKIWDSQCVAVSNAYFDLDNELLKVGIDSVRAPWSTSSSSNARLFLVLNKFYRKLLTAPLNELLGEKARSEFESIRASLSDWYSSAPIRILCLPHDVGTYERLSIDIFREQRKPSFLFSHGLPGRYNKFDDNRTDFLVVWGEQIKNNYIAQGIPEGKIIVSGHPTYQEYNIKDIDIKFSTDRILVLSKSMNGAQHSDKARLTDRGNMILYLWQVEAQLKRAGIRSAYFRPHPSENIAWYYRFISRDFFIPATSSLSRCLAETDLVIGPVSTVFIDSLIHGKNYLVYEPLYEGKDLLNYPLVPPFDGSDKRVPVASTPDELFELLKKKVVADKAILPEYIQTYFDISQVASIVQ